MSSSVYEPLQGFSSIQPFYLLIDVSPSMSTAISANGGTFTALQDVKEWCQSLIVLLINGETSSAGGELGMSDTDYNLVFQTGAIGIIAFGDTASSVVELTPVSELKYRDMQSELQKIADTQHGTRYGAAFDALKETISNDRNALERKYKERKRPAVFFITDGHPTDTDWLVKYEGLQTLEAFAPGIAALGFGKCKEETIQKIATKRHGGMGFIQDYTLGVGGSVVVGSIFRFILNSITMSTRNGWMQTPTNLDGFRPVEPQGY